MSDLDDKMPPLPGIKEEEMSDAVELENETTVDDSEDVIGPDTTFTKEELDLYSTEEILAICDLKGIDIPEGMNDVEELKNLIISGPPETEEVVVEDAIEESTEEEQSEGDEETIGPDTVFTEEELNEYSSEELKEICEAMEKEIPEEGRNTKAKLKKVILGTLESDPEESTPDTSVEEAVKVEEAPVTTNPIVEKAQEKKTYVPKEEKITPVKVKAEKELPASEIPTSEIPTVKVPQSALTIKDNVNEAGVLDYRPDASLDDLLRGAQKLIDGGLACGHVTPEAVLGVVKYGNEIGMSAMTSLNNIHMVNGKPTLGVHAIASQLKKFGVIWETLQHFEPEPEFENEFVTTIKFTDLGLIELYKRELTYASDNLKGAAQESYITIINEEIRPKLSQSFSYRWTDATSAGLVFKSNWTNHPKTMLFNRCLTLGGRAFKPEALMGMMETLEYAEVSGTEDSEHVIVLED